MFHDVINLLGFLTTELLVWWSQAPLNSYFLFLWAHLIMMPQQKISSPWCILGRSVRREEREASLWCVVWLPTGDLWVHLSECLFLLGRVRKLTGQAEVRRIRRPRRQRQRGSVGGKKWMSYKGETKRRKRLLTDTIHSTLSPPGKSHKIKVSFVKKTRESWVHPPYFQRLSIISKEQWDIATKGPRWRLVKLL